MGVRQGEVMASTAARKLAGREEEEAWQVQSLEAIVEVQMGGHLNWMKVAVGRQCGLLC